MSYIRATKKNPCPICEKDSWCVMFGDGTAAICMRVRSGMPKQFTDGQVGYIHRIKERPEKAVFVNRKKAERPAMDFSALHQKLLKSTKPEWKEKLAREIGVTYTSVVAIEAAWDSQHQAWSFPMRDGSGQVVGLRLRNERGEKWAVTGSKNALFIPEDHYTGCTLFVFEGPTDTCAGVTVGLRCIGRPSCSSGLFDIVTFVRLRMVNEVVIVSDSDKPGLDGAAVLTRHLPVRNTVLTTPTKDMREFVAIGGTDTMLLSLVRSMVWNQPIVGGGQ